MSGGERNERRHMVAVVGSPTFDKGRGVKVDAQVLGLLEETGRAHNFGIIDIIGTSFGDSLSQVCEHAHEYGYLVAASGDGMIALGANAVGCSGKPLNIATAGSDNDFAQGSGLPVNRIGTTVEGTTGVIACGSRIDVGMGRVTSLDGGYTVDPSTGGEYEYQESKSAEHPIDRYYAGILSCSPNASINGRANHSHLPIGAMRYFVTALVELTHMRHYGYHIEATLIGGAMDERDIITPLLTIVSSRHIGGGIEVSSYSCFSDGLSNLVWMDRVPNFGGRAVAILNAYNSKLPASKVFGQKCIREIEVMRVTGGDEPPVLTADGEYIGYLSFKVVAEGCALRVLVPPTVAVREVDSRQEVLNVIARDGRDSVTGQFM